MPTEKLSEEEMQALGESICSGIQNYIDAYPWDLAFVKAFGE